MTQVRRTVVLVLVLGAACLGSARPARAEPIVVVVGKDSPVSDLSLGDLQRIFLRLPMQDARSVPFVPINYPAKTSVREQFDRVVLGMSPEEVGQHWMDQMIRGRESPPRTIPSPSLLCRVVARLRGAIAYLPASFVGSQCKVVSIDGRGPKAPGYVLAAEAQARRATRAAGRLRWLLGQLGLRIALQLTASGSPKTPAPA